jgi:hypothetical protein
MVRLTRLKIDRFRNVKPGTDLRFGPTFNVLLGKNATGKSTLLDLVAAVTNDDLSAYANEEGGFDLTWWLERGDHQIEVRALRTPAKSKPLSLPELLQEETKFNDVLTIVLRTAQTEIGRLLVDGIRGQWKREHEPDVAFDLGAGLGAAGACLRSLVLVYDRYVYDSANQVVRLPEAPVVEDIRAAMDIVVPSMEKIGRFDEALGGIDAITRSPFVVSRSTASWAPWLPQNLLAIVRAVPGPVAVPLVDLASLAHISDLLGFRSAELRPRMLARSEEGENVRVTYEGIDCLFRRVDGSQISHKLLSFGQKRLFSFLWYLAIRKELPIIADELFNGLHHEWIEVCLDRLYERQSFLATQHPYLLDHVPIKSVDSVRISFIRCTLEQGSSGREQMVWRNFTEDEAERLFIAYQTGIPQVSEVLRTEGLW